MYMDVIKLLTKNEKELETLIQSVRIYSQDSDGICIEKCAMLVMKSGNDTLRTEWNYQIKEKSERPEKRKYYLQILGNIGNWHHQTCGDERKEFKSIPQKNEKSTRTKLYIRNFIKEINTCPPCKILGTILEEGQKRT